MNRLVDRARAAMNLLLVLLLLTIWGHLESRNDLDAFLVRLNRLISFEGHMVKSIKDKDRLARYLGDVGMERGELALIVKYRGSTPLSANEVLRMLRSWRGEFKTLLESQGLETETTEGLLGSTGNLTRFDDLIVTLETIVAYHALESGEVGVSRSPDLSSLSFRELQAPIVGLVPARVAVPWLAVASLFTLSYVLGTVVAIRRVAHVRWDPPEGLDWILHQQGWPSAILAIGWLLAPSIGLGVASIAYFDVDPIEIWDFELRLLPALGIVIAISVFLLGRSSRAMVLARLREFETQCERSFEVLPPAKPVPHPPAFDTSVGEQIGP